MNIREQAIQLLKQGNKELSGSSLAQSAKVFAWEAGLGPVFNAVPSLFGQQAVLYFPGRSKKISLPCCEHNGFILAALTDAELESISEPLLQSPGIEIWLKNGWYAGTARLLTPEEQTAVEQEMTASEFFGEAVSSATHRTLQSYKMLEITRSAPCTGAGGPGSKAWVWPIAAGLMLFTRKKK